MVPRDPVNTSFSPMPFVGEKENLGVGEHRKNVLFWLRFFLLLTGDGEVRLPPDQ